LATNNPQATTASDTKSSTLSNGVKSDAKHRSSGGPGTAFRRSGSFRSSANGARKRPASKADSDVDDEGAGPVFVRRRRAASFSDVGTSTKSRRHEVEASSQRRHMWSSRPDEVSPKTGDAPTTGVGRLAGLPPTSRPASGNNGNSRQKSTAAVDGDSTSWTATPRSSNRSTSKTAEAEEGSGRRRRGSGHRLRHRHRSTNEVCRLVFNGTFGTSGNTVL